MEGSILNSGTARLAAGALCLLVVGAGTGLLPVGSWAAGEAPTPIAPVPPGIAPVVLTSPPPATTAAGPRGTASASDSGVTLNASLGQGILVRGGDGSFYLHCGVEVADDAVATTERRPIDLALVLDTSGSMSGAMALLKQATLGIAERLGPADRLTVVSYASRADVVFQGTTAGPGKAALAAAVEGLRAWGGTNISAGIETGAAALMGTALGEPASRSRRAVSGERGEPVRPTPVVGCEDTPWAVAAPGGARRILLMTDGFANQGVRTAEGLSGIVTRLRGQGIALSALGLGYQYDEDLLAGLAEAGGGEYHYAAAPEQLAPVYRAEVESLQGLVAEGAVLELRPRAGVTVEEVFAWSATQAADGARQVRLGDLARGRGLKVVARLRLPADADAHDALDAVEVALSFKEAQSATERRIAPEGLRVALTDDAALAQRSVNEAIARDLRDVQVATRLEEARQRARAGDMQAARVRVMEAQAIAGDAKIEYEAPSGERRVLDFDGLADGYSGAAGAPAAERGRREGHAAGRALGR